MRKLHLLAAAALIPLTFALSQSFFSAMEVQAQNTQCSDRSTGDSSNACANTRFVHSAVGASFIAAGSPTQVQFNNGGAFGGLSEPSLTSKIIPFTTTISGSVPASGGGTTNFLRADGTFQPIGAASLPAGVNANTLITKTANYSIANTDCGSTLSGTGGPWTWTLPTVAGFPTTCSVVVCNGDPNDNTHHAQRLSGFPLPSFARLWMQQCQAVAIVNGAWQVTRFPGKFMPAFTPTLFIDTGGSSVNDGLISNAAANAVDTMQTCINLFYIEMDLGTRQPTCSPTAGQTNSASFTLQGLPTGTNVISITGNGGVAILRPTAGTGNFVMQLSDYAAAVITSNITFDCTGGTHPCFAAFLHQYSIADFNAGTKFVGANATDVGIWCDAQCRVNNSSGPITFGGTFGTGMAFNFGSQVQINNGITLVSPTTFNGNLIRLHRGSTMLLQSTFTMGTPINISANVIDANTGSQMTLSSTFGTSGGLVTGRQWAVLNNAVLCNDSATAIPGTAGLNTSSIAHLVGLVIPVNGDNCAGAFP